MATVRIQVRRGTASQWTSANPTLAAGELGVESDTNLFKFGNGSTAWTSLAYANNSDVAIGEISQDAINTALTMGAGLTKTYNDGANTITITVDSSVVALKSYVDSAVSTHEADTTSVHGIADTAALATKTYADSAVSTHEADTTSVHGIADTSILVTTTGSQTLTTKSLTSPTLTGTPVAPTATAGTDTTQIATTAFVQDAIELVVGAAPSALNTLAEIATSLADNADLSGTLTTSISNKVAKAGDTMSGALNMGTNKITNLGVPTVGTDASTKAYADGLVENSITSHTNTSLNVHGISNTANLVYTADTRLSDLRVPQDASVSTAKIVDLNVTTEKINDSAVTAAKIAAGAVQTSEIADLAVTTAKVADLAVTAGKIGDSAIIAAKLGVGAVETAALADLAVTTGKIADSAVTAAKILDGAVGTSELTDSAVTAAKILDGTVTGAKIAANAIAQSHLGDDSVGTNEIGGLAVTTGKIADTAVTTAKINDAAITSDKLAALAVTEGKIADSAVTTVKIADSAITTGKIANGAIIDADINAAAEIAQSKIASLTTDLAAKLASATAASTYAPLASPTFTGTVSGITKSMVGLGSADDTADTAKPVSTAQATAIATAKAEAIADATSQVNALLTGAPAALNTLDELAAALGDDANFASSVTTSLGLKAPLASPTFTGTVTVAAAGVAFTDGTQTKAGVPSLTTIATATSGAYNLSSGGLTLRDQLIPIGGTHVITVPTNTTTAYPVGTTISFYQSAGTGGSFAAADGTVTLLSTPGSTLRALYSSATLTKVATNTWLLAGDLKA